jgi:hypothetical protein
MLSDKNNGGGEYLEAIRSYLNDMASKAGLEFLANTGTSSDDNGSLIQNLGFRERTPLPLSDRLRSPPRWGFIE